MSTDSAYTFMTDICNRSSLENGLYIVWVKYSLLISHHLQHKFFNANFDARKRSFFYFLLTILIFHVVCPSAAWPSGTARWLQILCDGFDSWLEPKVFDVTYRVAADLRSASSLRSLLQLVLDFRFYIV